MLCYTSCELDTDSEKDTMARLDQTPFMVVDEVPVFPGCAEAVDKRACFNEKVQAHISRHFKYPEAAKEAGVQGRVSVMFVIGTDGRVGNVRMRGPDERLEAEVARIIGKLPKMEAGKQGGVPVPVPFSIPVSFVLEVPRPYPIKM